MLGSHLPLHLPGALCVRTSARAACDPLTGELRDPQDGCAVFLG
eukprot:COSAG02_NODE_353_length_24023_cov_77.872304_4_plen_44_part_00